MRRVMAVVLFLFWVIPQANAWGNKGHELVAYIAYMNLDPMIRPKVDALIQLNPCFAEWKTAVSSLPAAQQPVALFMLAATWPDKIKLTAPQSNTPYDCPGHPVFSITDGANGPDGHFSADIPPNIPEASQNIGYGDDRRHKYWHFIDTPLSGDGTATLPALEPNALTELILLAQALGSQEDPALKSYDLVWVEHLTGDIHQPLHDVQRFTKALPTGDEGGNLVAICSSSQPDCRAELHAYWDDLPGSDSSLSATIKMGLQLNKQAAPDDPTIDIDHPEHWVSAAVDLAKTDAYAPPFNTSTKQVDPSTISAGYHAKAVQDMRKQVFIAGNRLAKLLNNGLKN